MNASLRRVLACGLALWVWCGASTATADEDRPYLRLEIGTHIAAIRGLATDAGGDLLLSVSEDKTARLWRPSNGQLLRVLRPPIGPLNEGKLYAAALTPDGRVAAVSGWSAENDIYLFDCADGHMITRLSGLPNVVNRLAFSPDGQLLAAVLWGRNGLMLWRQGGGAAWSQPRLAGQHTDYGGDAYGLAFSPDGQQLVTSAYDGVLRQYALRGGNPLLQRALADRAGPHPHALAYSPDGHWLAVGHADTARVNVLQADTLAEAWQPPQPPAAPGSAAQGGLQQVAWSADGAALYAAGSWHEAGTQFAVRRWGDGGHARSLDMPAASDSLTALLSLPHQGIAFASADASWGLLASEGAPPSPRQSATAGRADFRAADAAFGVSADGTVLSFGYGFGGSTPARFDVRLLGWHAALSASAIVAPPTARTIEIKDWLDSPRPTVNGHALALEPGEISLTARADPQQSAAGLGSNFYLRLLDAQGHELWKQPAPAPCFALAFSADGRWLVAGYGDGTVRWHARGDGHELLAFYPHGDHKAWVAWTPDGRFSAGDGGEQLVGWQLNHGLDEAAEFLPLDRFHERYFDPLGVASALTAQPQHRPVADLREGLRLPPQLRLLSPKDGRRLREDQVMVEVSVQDRGGGVDEVRLLNNGKVVQTQDLGAGARAPADPGAPLLLRFELLLEPGANHLSALAFGRDRTASASAAVDVVAPEAPQRPQLRVLSVGVNVYRNSLLNLSYSVPDAKGLAAAFHGEGPELFKDVSVVELYDAEATKARIMSGLDALRSTRPEDVVVVYLAGHGETVADDWYFVPHELVQPEQDEALVRGGISSHELAAALRAMPARKVVVLIDACKSGAALAGFRGLEERRMLSQLSRAAGTHLIAATTKEQLASETRALGHGLFTYALLEGLKGNAAADGRDVTARKLMVYVEQQLPELTRRYRSEEQYPVVNSTGMDFPLMVRSTAPERSP